MGLVNSGGDVSEEFFAAPAFKPGEALVQLRRSLRDLRVLNERGDGFALKGRDVVALQVDEAVVLARLVKRPATTPEWDSFRLAATTDVRRFVDEAKRRVARWVEAER